MTRTREWLYAWLLLLPAAALLALFTHYPAVANLWHSFYSTPRANRPAKFIGLENYRALIDDPIFWQALTNNLWYALGTIPLSIGLALLMAVWVNERLPGRGFLRLAYFTPTILPMIAVANLWLFFYTPDYGLLDQLTRALLGWGPTNWIGTRETTRCAPFMRWRWPISAFPVRTTRSSPVFSMTSRTGRVRRDALRRCFARSPGRSEAGLTNGLPKP